MSKHTTTLPILFGYGGDEREIEVVIHYSYTPGRPATGPTYSCGGTPEEPAEVNILTATVLRATPRDTDEPAARWLFDYLQSSDDVYGELADKAAADLEPDPDAERDRRLDDEMGERTKESA